MIIRIQLEEWFVHKTTHTGDVWVTYIVSHPTVLSLSQLVIGLKTMFAEHKLKPSIISHGYINAQKQARRKW